MYKIDTTPKQTEAEKAIAFCTRMAAGLLILTAAARLFA